jgi:hypothetical protein
MHLIALLLLIAQDGKEGRAVAGEVVRVEGRTVTVSIKKDGGKTAEQTFKVDAETPVVIEGARGKLEDLKPGRTIRILVRGDVVQRVEVPGGERDGTAVDGEVVRLEDRTLVILVKRDGQKAAELPLKVDKEAGVAVNGEKAKLEDLKPGTTVRVLVRRDVAVRIEASRKREEAKPAEKPKVPEVKAPEKPAEKPKPAEGVKPPEPPKPPPEPPKPFPVDESIVTKGEKYPDLGGRVMSVFDDGPLILVTVRQNGEELPFYIPKDATVTYVALEKFEQKPRVGYLAYAWLKPGSKDTAAVVRFGRPK